MSASRHPYLDAILADARRELAEQSEAARRDWRRQIREATLAGDGERLRSVVEAGREKGWVR